MSDLESKRYKTIKTSENSRFSLKNTNHIKIKKYDNSGRLKEEEPDINFIKEEVSTESTFKRRTQKKRSSGKRNEHLQKSALSFDERIITTHNIMKPNLDIEEDTLKLVKENFTPKEWVNTEALEKKQNELVEKYNFYKKEMERIKAEKEAQGIVDSDTTEESQIDETDGNQKKLTNVIY